MFFSQKNQQASSVIVAKQRLYHLLSSDRIDCSPDMITQMKTDLYKTLSKYMEIDPHYYELTLNRTEMNIRYTGDKL